jgi:hypothetical protein
VGSARALIACRVVPAAAEALWYDTDRWPAFVDGCARVVAVEGQWPEPGAEVRWESTPAGRGDVVERVVAYEPGAGQELQVEDARLAGTQRIGFSPLEDGGSAVTLELAYRLKGAGLTGALVDVLFVRRAITDSLHRTLVRFAGELG